MFSREADDAVQAIVSAIRDVEAVGMTARGVAEDQVTVEDIAERAMVTATAVRYWIAGDRGPGGFPKPRVERHRGSLYSWAEVSAWLAAAKLGRADHLAAETARASALIHDALAVRRGIRELPKHDRPLVTALVA
jgi:predicted transcriptional regulator